MQQQYGDLVSIQEASEWASRLLNREVAPTNISYLVQYGKIKKYGDNGKTKVNLDDLKKYYDSFRGTREIQWRQQLGSDLNWNLSFDHLREKDTTKHVHRLHPYKGKFIPQLVEYFLDSHTDDFKTDTHFKSGDIVLDPFSGSGTTVVQSNELGMHGIGIDVSRFNSLIAEVKMLNYDLKSLGKCIENFIENLNFFEVNKTFESFENELVIKLNAFNLQNFPGADFKYRLNKQQLSEEKFGVDQEEKFIKIYNDLLFK